MEARVEFRKKKFLWNSFSGVATRILSITVLVWMHQYLLRRIEPAEYAIYAVVVSVLAFAPVIIELAAGGPRRYIIEAYARGDDDRIGDILRSITPTLLGFSVALFAFGSFVALRVEHVLTIPPEYVDQARWMVFLLAISLSAQLGTAPFVVGFHVRQRFALLNGIFFASELLRIALLMVLLIGVSPRVLWVVVASVVSTGLSLIVQWVVSHRLLPSLRFRLGRVRWDILREQFHFGGWTSLGNFAVMIRQAAPAIVLNKLATPVDVAAFHLGALPFRQLNQLVAKATEPIQPAITTMHALNQQDEMREAYLRGTRLQMWATLLPSCLLMGFAAEVIDLYVGDRYAKAATVLAVMFASFPVMASTNMLYRVVIATARVKGFSIANLLLNLMLLGLMLYFSWADYGAEGIAIAFLITSAGAACFWPYGNRLVGTRFRDFLREALVPGTLPFLAGLGAAYAWSAHFAPASWLALFVGFAAASLAYLLVLVPCLHASDRADLARIVQGVLARARPSAADAR